MTRSSASVLRRITIVSVMLLLHARGVAEAAILVQVSPIQSTTAFTSMPVGGWFFLLLGWAMAEARMQPQD